MRGNSIGRRVVGPHQPLVCLSSVPHAAFTLPFARFTLPFARFTLPFAQFTLVYAGDMTTLVTLFMNRARRTVNHVAVTVM